MSKAYLAWPVKLKDLSQELHVTLKYLGDSPFSLSDLGLRLAGIDTRLDLRNVTWTYERFDHGAHVLAFEKLWPEAYRAHGMVTDLRKDDYPIWRPHVSLPALPWVRIMRDKRQPVDMVEHVGPLTLYVDRKAVVTF